MYSRSTESLENDGIQVLSPWLIKGTVSGRISINDQLHTYKSELLEATSEVIEGPKNYAIKPKLGNITIKRDPNSAQRWFVQSTEQFAIPNIRHLLMVANLIVPFVTQEDRSDGIIVGLRWPEMLVTKETVSSDLVRLGTLHHRFMHINLEDADLICKRVGEDFVVLELRGIKNPRLQELIVERFRDGKLDLKELFDNELKKNSASITLGRFIRE